jgi:hypothetical protein
VRGGVRGELGGDFAGNQCDSELIHIYTSLIDL